MRKSGLLTRAVVLVVALAYAGGVFRAREDPVTGESQDEKPPSGAQQGKEVRTPPGGPSAAPEPDMHTVEILYTEETSDVEGLVGYSHNVFVGEVLEAVGDEPWSSTIPGDRKPQTQWSVEVLRTFKSSGPEPLREGDAATVNQVGGEDETGKPYVAQGVWGSLDGAAEEGGGEAGRPVELVDRLMRVGDLYLFSTHYDEANGWHAISAQPIGNVSLEGDEGRARRALEMYSEAAKDD